MTSPDRIPSRQLRKTRRRVAARLDLTGHPDAADRVRLFNIPELITLAQLENTP